VKFLARPRLLNAIAIVATLAALVAAGGAQARPPEGSELQLFIENDLLARTDRYYTSGIKLGGGASHDLLRLPTEILELIAPRAGSEVRFGLFLGQNLYTPRTITVSPHSRSTAPGPPGSTSAASRSGQRRTASTRWRSTSAWSAPPRWGGKSSPAGTS
jgi:hypothetical protein